jgi:hypothetical protein
VFFEHARFGFLGGLPRTNSRAPDVQNSLVAGKNAGNFAGSAAFFENQSRKHLRIQQFASEFPMQTSREFFCQRRDLVRASRDEQGIRAKSDPPADMPNLE